MPEKGKFKYPGKKPRKFTELLGHLAEGAGAWVTVTPEQWWSRKNFGPREVPQLNHFIKFALHGPEGDVVFSYRDPLFTIRDDVLEPFRDEGEEMILRLADEIAAQIQRRFPGADVMVVHKTQHVVKSD